MVRPALKFVNNLFERRLVIWGALLTIAGVVLSTLPLFDLLGFDFSFAIGLLAGFAAVDIGHGVVVAAHRTNRPVSLLHLTYLGALGAVCVLLIPLATSLANALRVRNCNLEVGFAFYALLPIASALFAAPAGVIAGVVFPRRGRLVAWSMPVVSIVWALLRLYVDPAVFALDPFAGYFPGPIYDEAMRPPERLIWFRLANAIWITTALALLALFSNGGRGTPEGPPRTQVPTRALWRTFILATTLVGVSIALFAQRGRLRFHVRHADLVAVLSRETHSRHFVVHSDPRDGQTAADLDLLVRDLEFRYDQLTRTLGVEPAGQIVLYDFPHSAAKKDLVGAGSTLYAKPWRREVFFQVDRFPASRLRHELAHVFASAFGDPLFGVALSVRFVGPLPLPRLASGLIEGVAEAADYGDPDSSSTVHQEARAIVADGRAPPLAKVVGAGFTALSGARAYTLAGSFCHFLLTEHGAERLRAVYHSGGDFQSVYGQPIEALESSWRAFLDKQPLDAADRARAKERFRRPAIFQKVCARELAARVAEARSHITSAPARAIELFESVCKDDPHEPTFRLDLVDALTAAGKDRAALALIDEIAAKPDTTLPLRARAENAAGAIHFYAGRFSDAEAAVKRTLAAASEEAEERTAQAKLRALADDGARRTLGRILFGDGPNRPVDPGLTVFLIDEFIRLYPDETLGPYLLARQLIWRDPKLALDQLTRACPSADQPPVKIPLDPPFAKECVRLIGDAAFRAGDLNRSRIAYEGLRKADREAERLRAEDFLERIAWEEARKSPKR